MGITDGRSSESPQNLPRGMRKNQVDQRQRVEFTNGGGIGMRGWIAVDLDGTLAKSVKAQKAEGIGVPIHPMVQLVKVWLARGEDVRIFTARVNPMRGQVNAMRARRAIEAWCKRHLRHVLPITHEKDWDMTLLFDDIARQVERDTGRVFCCDSRENRIAQEPRTGQSGGTCQEQG